MTLHVWDEVEFHNRRCHVEQVWDDMALLRPADGHMDAGVFITEQSTCTPVARDAEVHSP
jgi:hypothetical protein